MQLPPFHLISPSMMRSMPFRPCGCSSALILLLVLVFDPPRTNDGKIGSAFAGGMKDRTMSNVLSTPATTMPMIVRSTVRIYQIRGRDLWPKREFASKMRPSCLAASCMRADAFFDGRRTDDLVPTTSFRLPLALAFHSCSSNNSEKLTINCRSRLDRSMLKISILTRCKYLGRISIE